jgi:glc operon protein GlcG
MERIIWRGEGGCSGGGALLFGVTLDQFGGISQLGHMIMAQGAVPIIRNGVVEGACGVSGGTSQQDEDCARAGVAQL